MGLSFLSFPSVCSPNSREPCRWSYQRSSSIFCVSLTQTLMEGSKLCLPSPPSKVSVGDTPTLLKKADIEVTKRAGELSDEEVEKLITIMATPRQYKIPDWFLNRQKDIKDGKFSQVTSNQLENKLREDLERLKKIRAHRGLRHYWGLRVRGQHTKTTGRRGRTVGVSKKKGG